MKNTDFVLLRRRIRNKLTRFISQYLTHNFANIIIALLGLVLAATTFVLSIKDQDKQRQLDALQTLVKQNANQNQLSSQQIRQLIRLIYSVNWQDSISSNMLSRLEYQSNIEQQQLELAGDLNSLTLKNDYDSRVKEYYSLLRVFDNTQNVFSWSKFSYLASNWNTESIISSLDSLIQLIYQGLNNPLFSEHPRLISIWEKYLDFVKFIKEGVPDVGRWIRDDDTSVDSLKNLFRKKFPKLSDSEITSMSDSEWVSQSRIKFVQNFEENFYEFVGSTDEEIRQLEDEVFMNALYKNYDSMSLIQKDTLHDPIMDDPTRVNYIRRHTYDTIFYLNGKRVKFN